MRKCTIALLSSLLMTGLVGCGGGGGSDHPVAPVIDGGGSNGGVIESFFDSKYKNIANLSTVGKKYSDYNKQNTLVVKNIPVDNTTDALYICMVSNPNTTVTNFKLDTADTIVASRRSNSTTNGLLDSFNGLNGKYKSYRPSAVRLSGDNVVNKEDHKNEKVGQLVPMQYICFTSETEYKFIWRKNIKLMHISDHAKFFVDEEDYDGKDEFKDKGYYKYEKVTNKEIQEFANEFETISFPLLKKFFGNGSDVFWLDIDNDQKISILLTPTCTKLEGFIHPYYFELNGRDLINVSTLKSGFSREKWYGMVFDTMIHESQHLINASAKLEKCFPNIKNNIKELPKALNDDSYLKGVVKEKGFDEGLAVFSEFVLHKAKSEKGLDAYNEIYGTIGKDFLGNNVYLPDFTNNRNIPLEKEFQNNSDEYGQKGMFTYYLYEQFGEKAINGLCRGDFGTAKYNALDPKRNIYQLFIDFNFAFELEILRHYFKENKPHDKITDSKYKYIGDFSIDNGGKYLDASGTIKLASLDEYMDDNTLPLGHNTDKTYPIAAKGGIETIFIKQPKDYKGKTFNLTFTADKPVIVNMLRIQ